ncbi:MAG: hypothetical protein ACI4ET_05575 [Bilifractor sp.]
MNENEEKTILLPYESWAYLKARSREERIGKKTSDALLKNMWSVLAKEDGQVRLNGKAMGGRKDGEITSWSVEDLKNMLDKQNLPYTE